MITGGVAFEHLPKKSMHRGRWIERALAPRVVQLAADSFDHRGRQDPRHFTLDLRQNGSDKGSHPWPPGEW